MQIVVILLIETGEHGTFPVKYSEGAYPDEPTGALNKSATKEVMSAMNALNKDGTTILMVTHNSKLASRCNRVLYILDGQIKGEYRFERNDQNNDKEREEKLACWLSDYDW